MNYEGATSEFGKITHTLSGQSVVFCYHSSGSSLEGHFTVEDKHYIVLIALN